MQSDTPNPVKDALTSPSGQILNGIPHCRAMGMELLSADEGRAVMRLPYSEMLIGDPSTGVISGGAVTALLDTCCGSAVMSSDKGLRSTATLDLRIDYMRPATPKEALLAVAEVYRVTRTVGFVRALAHHGDESKPVASASATFILERTSK